ncbi:putative aldouronate transport system substrate-binding protein [Paenibacillus sp. UNCCL117]|uniref:extracellular solute-binding protein n=1 Tax=unclassified Paenibacillus TaxID=185978 RepID=UPI00088FA666|nr:MULTISPECIES: extracellular solute-binding protein [unclassified Paenibacillus]SDD24541.1 putative aldouronate transport system substrate-binding protein [Paenibacillus sp. cl123]SFW41465.1 putative aldouronate transport system substrate-binding protein [Paenibacillus sp. UNCCL117]
MKKSLIILTLALLAGLVSACSEGNNDPAASNSGGAGTGGDQPKEPVVIQSANLFPNLTADNPVMQELAKRTNVKFDLVTVTGDRNQKFDVWLASGDYPKDTLVLKPDYIAKYRDAGAILPLEDLIEEYGTNIKAKYGEYFDLLKDEDGHIYSLYVPNISTEAAPQQQASFAVRYDVLEDAGYPEIKTLDQLFEVLKAYYEKHPTIDGKKMIPFSGFSYNNKGGENLSAPVFAASGLTDHGKFKIDDDNNAKLIYDSQELKSYYSFLNKLYNAGMLDIEFFTLNNDGMTKKITEGRVLAGYFPDWYVQPEVEKVMRASGDTGNLFAYFPLLLDKNMENNTFASLKTRSNWNWAISANSKHPEEAIKLLDYMFSDEAQILINWGIEGVHYEVKDGKRAVTESYKQQLANNPDALWSEHGSIFYGTSMYFAHGTKLGDGDYATPTTKESVKSGYDDRTNEVLSQYGKEVWSDFLPELNYIPASLGQLGELEDTRGELARIEQIWLKESANLVFSKTQEQFEQVWTRYVAALEQAGARTVEDKYTALWKSATDRYSAIMK